MNRTKTQRSEANSSLRAGFTVRIITIRGDHLAVCEWCGWVSGRLTGQALACCGQCGLGISAPQSAAQR